MKSTFQHGKWRKKLVSSPENERKMKQKHYYNGIESRIYTLDPHVIPWLKTSQPQPGSSSQISCALSRGLRQHFVEKPVRTPALFQKPTSTENNHLDNDISNPEVEPAVSSQKDSQDP